MEYNYAPPSAASPPGPEENAFIGLAWPLGGEGHFLDGITGSQRSAAFSGNISQYPAFALRFEPGPPLPPLAGGVYSVGSGGAFSSPTEALAQVEQRGLAGPVTPSLIDSVYAVSAFGGREVFPWVMGSASGGAHHLVIEAADSGYRQLRAYGVHFQNDSGSNQPVLFRVFSNTLAPLATNRSYGLVYLLGADHVTLRRFGFVAQTPLNWLERGVVIGASDGQDGPQYYVVDKWRLHFPYNTEYWPGGSRLTTFPFLFSSFAIGNQFSQHFLGSGNPGSPHRWVSGRRHLDAR